MPLKKEQASRVKSNFSDYRNTTITAGYTEKIPFSFGPKGLAGLPGLILETLQNEKRITRAFEIDWAMGGFIAKPTTGKKMPKMSGLKK